jgi:hypothetical protein
VDSLFEIDFGDRLDVVLAEEEGYTFAHWAQHWVMPVVKVRRSATGEVDPAQHHNRSCRC